MSIIDPGGYRQHELQITEARATGQSHSETPPGVRHPSWKHDVAAEHSRLATVATFAITDHMEQNKITRAELAHRMGVSPGRVSQILASDENPTLRTLATVATALDGHIDVTFRPKSETER